MPAQKGRKVERNSPLFRSRAWCRNGERFCGMSPLLFGPTSRLPPLGSEPASFRAARCGKRRRRETRPPRVPGPSSPPPPVAGRLSVTCLLWQRGPPARVREAEAVAGAGVGDGRRCTGPAGPAGPAVGLAGERRPGRACASPPVERRGRSAGSFVHVLRGLADCREERARGWRGRSPGSRRSAGRAAGPVSSWCLPAPLLA